MTLTAFHHDERILESGGTHGNSATAALGRPSLENWDLFTRETLQNSWDARDQVSADDGVTFSIDYQELKGFRADALRDFFADGTRGIDELQRFLDQPESTPLPFLMVSDTGTCGLQGPTSAAIAYEGRDDFVSFVRNIGRRQEKELKGGTYGFGKGVFFNMSDVDAVLVYSRTVDEHGAPVSRFIAMANSNGYSHGHTNYTGRHWWGQEAEGSNNNVFVNPFTGSDADALARTFLMDSHFTEIRPTGTTVAVLKPRMDSGETDEVMQRIADALTKWAWPHMVVQREDMDAIDFSVTSRGRTIEIPDPTRDPALKNFVSAYRTALKEPEHPSPRDFVKTFQRSGMHVWMDIVSSSPAEYLGRLAFRRTDAEQIHTTSVLPEDMTHHIALLRAPRMVVNYWKGPRSTSDENYSGVFIASDELDPLFAGSEPPAHDEWNPETVNLKDVRFYSPKTNKSRRTNPVNVALRELKSNLRMKAVSAVEKNSSDDDSALNTISNALGSIVPTMSGESSRVSMPKPMNKSKPAKTSPRGVKALIELDGLHPSVRGTVAVFAVSVESKRSALDEGTRIGVETAIIVDRKRVTEAVDGLELPTPLGWLSPSSTPEDWNTIAGRQTESDDLYLKMRSETWNGRYAVLQPEDTAITADVVIEIGETGEDEK